MCAITQFHLLVLTETKKTNSEVGKMGKFGILPAYETKWLVNQREKGTNWVHIYCKKEIFEQENIQVERGVAGCPNDGRALIWKHSKSKIMVKVEYLQWTTRKERSGMGQILRSKEKELFEQCDGIKGKIMKYWINRWLYRFEKKIGDYREWV